MFGRKEFEVVDIGSRRYNRYVVVVNIGRMLAINDCCGHARGDDLINGYGVWLGRYGDVYRTKGNEFAIVTNEPTKVMLEVDKLGLGIMDEQMIEDLGECRYLRMSKIGQLYVREMRLLGRADG